MANYQVEIEGRKYKVENVASPEAAEAEVRSMLGQTPPPAQTAPVTPEPKTGGMGSVTGALENIRSSLGDKLQGDAPLFDPDVKRLDFFPAPTGAIKGNEGEASLTDWTAPQFAVDMYEAAKTAGAPGASPSDITEGAIQALPVGRGVAPLLGGRGVTGITKQQVKNTPLSQQRIKEADALYKASRESGDVLNKNDFASQLAVIRKTLADERFDPDAHKNTAEQLKIITKKVGQDVDMGDLKQLREFAKDAAYESEKNGDKRLGKFLLKGVEKMIDDLSSEGGKKLRGADKKFSQGMKVKTMDDALFQADLQASGVENGLRIALRSILRSDRKRAFFNKEEIDLMKTVVKGDMGANALKKLSKIGVGSGQQSNALMALLGSSAGVGLGTAAFGPAGAVLGLAVPAIGTAAGKAADSATMKAYNKARAAMAGVKPVRTKMDPLRQQETIGRLGMSQGLLDLLDEGA